MILSMTGFSSSTLLLTLPKKDTQLQKRIYCTMTLKTLNSRFFETNCKLPYSVSHLETELIKLFKTKLIRGNVYFTLHMTNPQALTSNIEPALGTIEAYINGLKAIQNQFGISGEININTLLSLPQIFEFQETMLDEAVTNNILKSAQDLTEDLMKARLKEGKLLAQDLKQRIKIISQYMKELAPRAEIVMEQRKIQLFANLKKVLQEQNQETTVETQNALLHNQLDKIDVHEEIIRFKSHLNNLSDILESQEQENGKKLDFTLQELFREINTLSAKCPDSIISSLVINIKVELEKSREQAQNIV